MKASKRIVSLVLPLAFLACKKEEKAPAPNKAVEAPMPATQVEKEEPPAIEPGAAVGSSIKAQNAAGSYELDGAHSQALFKISHFGASNLSGMFRNVSGSFVLDADDPTKSSAQVEIEAASIFTAVQKRDDHLKSPDFFDVKQFPKITFKSTEVKPTGPNLYDVTGDLTIHGVTKPVTIAMTHNAALELPKEMGGNFITGFDGEVTINRHDFGISWGKGALGDEVAISLTFEGKRK